MKRGWLAWYAAIWNRKAIRFLRPQTGREALFVAREQQPDLIVLDLMMPEMDGWEFMRLHRKDYDTPIIMLTARIDDIDKVAGLEMGADDYITKPFSPRELVARVRAVLRRTEPAAEKSVVLRAGELELDQTARSLKVKDNYVELTRMEFDLLQTLMGSPGRAFNRLELLERTQGYAYDGYERCQCVLVVIWDRASWHKSKKVKRWVYQYNRQAKREEQGVRLLTLLLPTKSPWLNPMEPIWLHAKRKVVEPDGDLSVKVLKARLCAHFQTTLESATLKVSA